MKRSDAAKKIFYQELSRRSFWHFCLYMDGEFFADRAFLKDVADGFQAIEDKKIKSLAISMPPRAGKSYITSLFCAWVLGRNPRESVMRNTCTATLYIKFSYDVRAIVKSIRFKEVFKLNLSDDKKNLNGWNVNGAKMVSYFGAGVGGTIIGFGASKVAITDDLYRGMEDALSDTTNDRIIQWKEATHDSRFESGCARIDIGTRWARNDVMGRNSADEVYDKEIIVKALDADGNSFCESVMTSEEYALKKKKTPKHIWMAEYQQQPIDLEGRLFENLQRINDEEFKEIKEKISGCIAYIDVADMGMDYTAMAIGAIIDDQVIIVDYLFNRDNTDINIPLAAAKLNEWGVNYCRVESNSMGAMFARQLQQLTKTKILSIHNQTNKITRIIMQSAFIKNFINFQAKESSPDYHQFMENLESFSKEGKNKNDDAPDCMAGLSMFIRSMFKKQFG
jgi:predicted phage terminase large subunit-like protein